MSRRKPLLRWYERRILLPAMALLTLVLALAVLDLRHQQVPASAGTPTGGTARPPAAPPAVTSKDDARAPAPKHEPATAAAWEPLRCGAPARSTRRDPLYATDPDSRIALAVDAAGHLALYGGADPATGEPTDDAYEVLRDCSPGLAFGNYASVLVEGQNAEPAGSSTLTGPTRRASDGSLLTGFSFPGGVVVQQRLRLEGRDLELSYRLENRSGMSRTVSLRSLLTPPAQTGTKGEPRFVLPPLGNEPPADAEGLRLRSERNLRGEEVVPFEVPRRGVPSDSGGRWGPAGGDRPDRLTFAGTLRLQAAPFLYDTRNGEPLPDASSFAAYWLGRELGPGESFAVSQRYATAGAGGAR